MRTVPEEIARKLVAGTDRLSVGFEDVRMDDIARASGIPRATLYYHFPSRQDVLTFLHDAMLEEYRTTVVADDHGSARERLTRLFERLVEHVVRHPGAAQILLANTGQLAKLSELATGAYDPLLEQIEPILCAGIASGEMHALDVARTAAALSALAHVTITRALLTGELDDGPELARWLVELVWDGMGHSDKEPSDGRDPRSPVVRPRPAGAV